MVRNPVQLKSALDKCTAYAVNKMADEVKKKIEEFVEYYYSEYNPIQYERTLKFLNSVTRTEVKKVGNEWQAEVYIDLSIAYDNNWTMRGTAESANQGMHGWYHPGMTSGIHFWDMAMEEIMSPEFMNKFAGFLKSKGLKVTIR